MDFFRKQDIFVKQMVEDYQHNKIPNQEKLALYFRWKAGECSYADISHQAACEMRETASDMLDEYYNKYPDAYSSMSSDNEDPWCGHAGFGEDKYIVSYLESVVDELGNILPILK